MHIWRVNVGNQTMSRTPVPKYWQELGGRGLIARILLDEVPPTCEPLGPLNKVVYSPGLLVGHGLSSCDRISVGAKSPLTRGIKESNAGGTTGYQMTSLGIKALIIEGEPQDNHWWLLHISNEGFKFEPADDLVGLGVYQTARVLLNRYGPKIAISIIGPGGEMQLPTAGILNLDKDQTPSRINARGGIGAVLGSKKIKAIIINGNQGKKPPIAHPEDFKKAQKEFTQALMTHPQTAIYRDYGTAAIAGMSNSLGGLPTRNFSQGQFEGIDTINGERLREVLLKRGGKSNPSHACMAGCTIRCSNVFADENGDEVVSPLEYETIGLLGSNLGIDNLDWIARLNYEVNDLGLDSIEVGAALGIAAEAGLFLFGDAEKAFELIKGIRMGTPLGLLIGNGASWTGKTLGVQRIPTVKNQAISAYDPRAIKGTGVTYATSPQGADHTAGLTIRAKVDHTNPVGQVALSRNAQLNNAGYDTLGVCVFASFGFAAIPTAIRGLLNARYDWRVSQNILQELGRKTIELEREFNRGAGFAAEDDRIPKWMTKEPLEPTNAVFDVPENELDEIFF